MQRKSSEFLKIGKAKFKKQKFEKIGQSIKNSANLLFDCFNGPVFLQTVDRNHLSL